VILNAFPNLSRELGTSLALRPSSQVFFYLYICLETFNLIFLLRKYIDDPFIFQWHFCLHFCILLIVNVGVSPSGKASVFGTDTLGSNPSTPANIVFL
jgi:hypothetical protein